MVAHGRHKQDAWRSVSHRLLPGRGFVFLRIRRPRLDSMRQLPLRRFGGDISEPVLLDVWRDRPAAQLQCNLFAPDDLRSLCREGRVGQLLLQRRAVHGAVWRQVSQELQTVHDVFDGRRSRHPTCVLIRRSALYRGEPARRIGRRSPELGYPQRTGLSQSNL